MPSDRNKYPPRFFQAYMCVLKIELKISLVAKIKKYNKIAGTIVPATLFDDKFHASRNKLQNANKKSSQLPKFQIYLQTKRTLDH